MCAQQADDFLAKCFTAVQNPSDDDTSQYLLLGEVLVRKWYLLVEGEKEWKTVFQIVVPKAYRQQVLNLAHDNHFAAHPGVMKTYDCILRHVFGLG